MSRDGTLESASHFGWGFRVAIFALLLTAQIGHLIEHLAVRIVGSPLLGPTADTEETHLIFNGLIAVGALLLVWTFPRNPWVYPLALLSTLHGFEHVYIFEQYVRTGFAGGPGLFGLGGALELFPVPRIDLHNTYNAAELILITLGAWHEGDIRMAD